MLAYHNVSLGIDAVLTHEDRIKSELPKVDRAALRALPSLALTVGFAALQVDRGAGSAELRRMGMWLWLDDVDAHVPQLQSRTAAPRKKPAPPAGV